MENDYYSPVAEFYDFVPRAHGESEHALRAVLAEVDSSTGPVVDIGAGTGRTCRIIADVLPQAQILACEPSPVMRAILTHDVLADEDLRSRVTIEAEPLETVGLPDQISALVLFGVIGHVGPEARRALWDRALPRLAPGAPIVVELLPLTRPAKMPKMALASGRIGDHLYEGWVEAEPIGDDLLQMTSTWQVSGGATPTRVVRNVSRWHTFGIEELAEETGWVGEQLSAQAGVLRAPGD